MIKISMRIVLVFFIALVFCSDDKKYSLIPDRSVANLPVVGNILIFHHVEELYFDLPGRGRYHNVAEFDNIEEYMGEQDGFYIIKLTRVNMNVDYRIGDIEDKPYDYLAMEDAPCLLYINKDGWDDHVEPVNPEHAFLQEVFEAAYIDDRGISNFFYPFGANAINISEGDSWYRKQDSIRMYLNSDSPESWASRNTTYTLKKVKMKKGKQIATISIKSHLPRA